MWFAPESATDNTWHWPGVEFGIGLTAELLAWMCAADAVMVRLAYTDTIVHLWWQEYRLDEARTAFRVALLAATASDESS